MGKILSFPEKSEPHLRGTVLCLHCHYSWEGVCAVGVTTGLACPNCGRAKGVFEGLVEPEGAYFQCSCGCYLFLIIPNGCQCLMCGTLASGF